MIQAIKNKYRLAKYYYTQMYLVSSNGGSFIQPLFFQFPNDINAKSDLQYNMMIGEALKLGVNSDKLDQN
jgi:alpha-glucosidase (family GH31 glycosyl hydrolase)